MLPIISGTYAKKHTDNNAANHESGIVSVEMSGETAGDSSQDTTH